MNISFSNSYIVLIACILLVGCRQNNIKETDGLAVIDVVNNLGKYHEIPVSEFVSELEYIPLETGDDCLIGEHIRDLAVTSTHIFVRDETNCYAFDRDGRFITQIGRVGQGPGEYQFISGLSVDEKNQSLYIETFRTILEYSFDGVFHQSIPIPKNMMGSPLGDISFVRDNLFIGHVPNYSGNEMFNFLLFDNSGEVVKSFDNHVKLDRAKPMYFFAADAAMQPFRLSGNMYVKENSNDTLYCLNEQNDLVPHYVFDLGKYVFSKEKREEESRSRSNLNGVIEVPCTFIPGMISIPHYLFFSITAHELPTNIPFPKKRVRLTVVPPGAQRIVAHPVVGIYDIVNQKTRFLDTDPVSMLHGLINDLDGGLSFWPRYATSDNELIEIRQAFEMKEILTEEYFAAHKFKNPQAHQKLNELLKNLDWEDNPVLVIGKLK